MTLFELLDMQRESQTHSDTQPETLEQIHLAQLAELGEIVQAVKWGQKPVSKYPAWAWSECAEKTPATRSQVADKIADLLCFVLLEGLFLEQQGELDLNEYYDYWDIYWEPTRSLSFPFAVTSFFKDGNGRESFEFALFSIVNISKALGFTRDEIEATYDKNVARGCGMV